MTFGVSGLFFEQRAHCFGHFLRHQILTLFLSRTLLHHFNIVVLVIIGVFACFIDLTFKEGRRTCSTTGCDAKSSFELPASKIRLAHFENFNFSFDVFLYRRSLTEESLVFRVGNRGLMYDNEVGICQVTSSF